MDKKYKILLLAVLAVLLVVMAYSYSQLPFYPPDYPSAPNLTQGDRLLVVAPHPDDEVICNGGIIHYAAQHNIPVKVVVVTDGNDGKTSSLIRHNESINGTRTLGLTENDTIFLGYADGSLKSLLNDNWDDNNPFTPSNGSTRISYPYAYQENATFSGSSLDSNLESIINDFKPTVVIYPSGDDEQLDHQATSGFVEYALTKTQYNGSRYSYLLHLPPNWPKPRTYYSEYYLYPPTEFLGLKNGPEWFIFNLNSFDERIKEQSYRAYKTQIVPSSYLWSFLRKNELFTQYPNLNISQNLSGSMDYSSSSVVPSILFEDAKGDVKNEKTLASLDIIAVGMNMNSDGSWMSIQTVTTPSSPSGKFTVNMKVLSPEGLKNVKIKIENGTGQLQSDVNGMISTTSVPVLVKNNTMMFEIPSSIFTNSPYFILSAESSQNSEVVDQTAWRFVKIL